MADEKFTKHTITNISSGPKVVNSRQGHLLQAGQVAEDVELNEAELASAKATGYFEFGESSISSLKKADLTAIADAEGIAYDASDSRADLIGKIEAARAAK